MSIGTATGEPMATGEDFERDWSAARSGTLEVPERQPAVEAGTPTPSTPAAPVTPPPAAAPASPAAPPVAAQEPTPAAQPTWTLPPEVVAQFPQEMRSPEAIARAARQYLSLQGNLPQLEQRWRQQYVAPVEQELNALREERRQALEHLVQFDPNTNQPRTPQEQAYIRQQLTQAQAQQTEQQQRTQEQQELAQARQVIQQREQEVKAQGVGALRLTALNALPLWKQQVAQEYGVPMAELDTYTTKFGYEDRIKGLGEEEMRQVGPMLESIQQYAMMRQEQLQGEQARLATAGQRYRDVGTPSGTGGQASADRWQKSNSDDFQSAWERAKRGELV